MIDAVPFEGDTFDPSVRSCLVSTTESGDVDPTKAVLVVCEPVEATDDLVWVAVAMLGLRQVNVIWFERSGVPLELPAALTLLDDPTTAENALVRLQNSWARMANHAARTDSPMLAEVAAHVAGAIDTAHIVVIECIKAELCQRDGDLVREREERADEERPGDKGVDATVDRDGPDDRAGRE